MRGLSPETAREALATLFSPLADALMCIRALSNRRPKLRVETECRVGTGDAPTSVLSLAPYRARAREAVTPDFAKLPCWPILAARGTLTMRTFGS
jgi:hypothetical protein